MNDAGAKLFINRKLPFWLTPPGVLASLSPASDAVHEQRVAVTELDKALMSIEAKNGRELPASRHVARGIDARPAFKRTEQKR